jgi:glycosyltransferase involved in cell wall biosynthesis
MTDSLRIGIDLRYPEFAFKRGIGRYTLQQLHHYYLFCLKSTPIMAMAFSQYPNVTLCRHFVSYPLTDLTQLPITSRAIERQLSYYIQHYQLDFLHIPTMFHFIQPIPEHLGDYPVLITVYDLIPYLYMPHFDFSPPIQAQYARGMEYIKTAKHLIAISEATKNDVVNHLGCDPNKITVVYPALDTHFTVLSPDVVQERLNGLWEHLKIRRPERYILTVTDHFYTKNLDTLLIAYAQLPLADREACPLVVTFDILGKDLIRFTKQVQDLGIPAEQVIFTRRVSEEQLVALYNGAMFVVYPSRYEGFGYPIAEAMACGSAVITTTAASMPEVAGEAAMLVDAEQAEEFTEAMHTLLHDSALRQTLREKGLMQCQQFNLDNMAQATLVAYSTFAPYTQSTPPITMPMGYRVILASLSVYIKVRWAVRYVKWWAYHNVYYPLKRRVLGLK